MSSSRTSQNARTRLAALREKKPPSKAAQIRALWPEIRTALDNGHSLQAVCDCLAADGIAVSVQSLGSYIGRIRRDSGKRESVTPSTVLADPGSTNANERVAVLPVREQKANDPLANVKQRQAKRPTFDYKPELADAKDLI
jgi:hypothetical protein